MPLSPTTSREKPEHLAHRTRHDLVAPRTFGAEENGVAAERITGQRCTPEFLQELGITPIRGRLFTAAEDEIDLPEPVV